MNHILIDEFSRLIAYIIEESDKYQQAKEIKKVTQNNFRIKQLTVV